MTIVYLILIFLLVVPVALVVCCAAVEASFMKNCPQLSWLLPAVYMLASALIGLDDSSGVDGLLWALPVLYGRCILAGTAGGAVIGAVLRWFGVPARAQDEMC